MGIQTVYMLNGNGYCCEGCALKEKEFEEIRDSLEGAHLALADSLAKALDVREKETGMHSKRVACHTLMLARRFSDDDDWLHQVYWGALLHDVGKIGVPDHVLLKAGPLTGKEWEKMRRHPDIGNEILSSVPFMRGAAEIVHAHQERFDGTGYPCGLAGNAIPLGARLFTVIDTLDAITSDRPYRKAGTFEKAKNEIENCAITQFDPTAVEAFLASEKELRKMVEMKCAKTF